LAAAFTGLVLLIIAIADWGGGPALFPWFYDWPGLDKVGHLVLMGVLAYLVNRAAGLFWPGRMGLTWMSVPTLVLLVLVTAEECSQLWLINRSFDLWDLGCDFVGLFAGGMWAEWELARRAGPGRLFPGYSQSKKST
jgi:hypothetical protein